MTDVVEIAKERHVWLAAELAKVGDFLRMADALLRQKLSKSNEALDIEDDKAVESAGLVTALPYSAVTGGYGAEAEHEGLPVRELKAEKRVTPSPQISRLHIRSLST